MISLPLLLTLVVAAGDDPYIRSRVDTGVLIDPNAHCLWWDQQDVVFRQHVRGNPDTTGETEFIAVAASLQTWADANAACGHLAISEGPRVNDHLIGISSTGGSDQNVIVFRETWCGDEVPASHPCWQDESCMNTHDCWNMSKNTIALTTTTYETRTGRIFDADVELNAAFFVFTTVDGPPCTPPVFNQSCIATDVQNTMTHELGHALGLDHTRSAGSTMNATAPGGEISKRVLDPGSRQFICDTYPVGRPPQDCVVQPVPQPNALGASAGCANGAFAVMALGVGLALALGGRRRRLR